MDFSSEEASVAPEVEALDSKSKDSPWLFSEIIDSTSFSICFFVILILASMEAGSSLSSGSFISGPIFEVIESSIDQIPTCAQCSIDLNLHSCIPVSYTHLDVYKRQR